MLTDPVLQGIRVVEVGQYVAAPLAATIFADLGAEVVKVERPGGDPQRADAARFAAWNRGKQTVELDLTTPEGRGELHALLDEADVLLENLRPGALEHLLGHDLRAGHPRLVTCSISAWGSNGPSRDDPGWEALVHSRAGVQQGLFTGDDPIWMPFPVASVAAALLAVIGSAAALVKRESTGYGQHVETSLLDALLFLNAAPIFHRTGHRPKVTRQRNSVILRLYDTADGRSMMVNLSGTERWRELCRLARHRRRWPRLRHARRAGQAVGPRVEPGQARRDHGGVRRQDGGRVGVGARANDRPRWPSATRWPSGWRASRRGSTNW